MPQNTKTLRFVKMQGCGNDYIYFDCFDQSISDPAALSVRLSRYHFGVGADGIILILPSDTADAKMRIFNQDGSEGKMCGNGVRCVGKYLYDSGRVPKETMRIETLSGIKTLYLTLEEGCAALLKALGYDPSALKGAYPAAQLAKASSIGLLDQVSAAQGARLTRQDCVNLFYNLLTAKTSAGTVYGTILGCSVTNGQVDYSALVSAGTKGPYVAESAALSLPFTSGTVYYNGAASSLSAVQQYDVYYYSANMSTVWVYHDRVTGTLTGPHKVTYHS